MTDLTLGTGVAGNQLPPYVSTGWPAEPSPTLLSGAFSQPGPRPRRKVKVLLPVTDRTGYPVGKGVIMCRRRDPKQICIQVCLLIVIRLTPMVLNRSSFFPVHKQGDQLFMYISTQLLLFE